MERGLSTTWAPESISFSSCGTYLVIQPDFPKNSEPVVIRCPEILSETTKSVLKTSILSSDAPGASSTTDKAPDESQTLTTTRGQSRELSKALASTMMTQVDTSGAGTEVSLTRYEGQAVQKSKVVTLPRSAHFEGAVHKVLPHLSQQDMFRVSVDMDRRRHYSLDAPSGGPNASVIEKHAAFVGISSSPSPSTRTHEHGLGRLAVDGVEWKQCKCDVPWTGGYMAIHSRGASGLGDPDVVNLMKPAEIPAVHERFSSQGCSVCPGSVPASSNEPGSLKRPKDEGDGEAAPEIKLTAPPGKSIWKTISSYAKPFLWTAK